MSRTANETKEALYVAAILRGATKKAAAMEAGFSESTAGHSATRLHKTESVQKALDSARQELKTQTLYGIQECIGEIDETIAYARLHKNSMAMAKLIELKAKLMGLLVDKLDVRWQEKPSIEGALAEALNRRTKIINPPQLSGPHPLPKLESAIDPFGD
jgi:hypothetical protein